MSATANELDATDLPQSADHYRIVVRANPDAGPFTRLLKGWNFQGQWMCSIQSHPIEMSIADPSGNRQVKISIDIQVTHDDIRTAVQEAIKAHDQAAAELDQPPIRG